ncbi:MAG: hypothetical protein HC862_24235 [Scytonema sp. RU_4_4]|nr:hypothetical protein [Scytonema sp. RU_4_4]
MSDHRRYSEQGPAPSWKLDNSRIVKVLRVPIVLKVTALAMTIGTLPFMAVKTVADNLANQSVSKAIMTQVQQTRTSALVDEVHRVIPAAHLPILVNSQVRQVNTLEQKQAVLNRYIEVLQEFDNIVVKIDNAYRLMTYVLWKTPKSLPNLNREVVLVVNKVAESANPQDFLPRLVFQIGLIGFLLVAIALF